MQQQVKHYLQLSLKGVGWGGDGWVTDLTKENNSVIKIMEKAWGFECETINKQQNVLNLIWLQVSEEYTEACLLTEEKIENLSLTSRYLIVQNTRSAEWYCCLKWHFVIGVLSCS